LKAPAFYEKRGYVRIDETDGYPGGAHKIFMKKQLKDSALLQTAAAYWADSPHRRREV
jgi:hypothetical protein